MKRKMKIAIILSILLIIGVISISILLLKNSLFQLPQPYQPNITVVKAQYNEGVWRDYVGFTVVWLRNEGEYFRRAEIYDKVTNENYVIVNIKHNQTFPITLAYRATNVTFKFDFGVSQTVSWELNEV